MNVYVLGKTFFFLAREFCINALVIGMFGVVVRSGRGLYVRVRIS